MKDLINTILVHVFYAIADISSKHSNRFAYRIYKWSIDNSLYFDEKLDYKFWTNNK